MNDGIAIGEKILRAGSYDPRVIRPYVGSPLQDFASKITILGANDEPKEIDSEMQAILTRDEWLHMDQLFIHEFQQHSWLARFFHQCNGESPYHQSIGQETGMVWRPPYVPQPPLSPVDKAVAEQKIEALEEAGCTVNMVHLPIARLYCEFEITYYDLKLARNTGRPLDVQDIVKSGASLSLELERLLAGNGEPHQDRGFFAYGMMNHPKVNRMSFPAGHPNRFKKSVSEMINLLYTRKYYGPYALVMPFNDPRICMPGGNLLDLLDLHVFHIILTEGIPEGHSLLFQATSDAIRLVVGMDPLVVQWTPTTYRDNDRDFEKGWLFRAMLHASPQVRENAEQEVGIVHAS